MRTDILKIKDSSGNWIGIPALQGGAGPQGRGVESIALLTGGHTSGTTDVYRLTYTDGTFMDFEVYNGADGGGSGDMLAATYDPAGGAKQVAFTDQIPTVPTKVSAFTNDSGYLTEHQDISGKVDKVTGKGLSTNDYTTAEKTKLAGIADGADVNVQPDWDATTGDGAIANKPTKLSEFSNDPGFITSAPVTSVGGKTGAVTAAQLKTAIADITYGELT